MYSEKSEQDRSSLGVVLDPTVKIRPSEKLQNYISSNASKILPEEQYLSIGNIKELHMKMKTEEEVYLNDLMEGSEICIPGLVIPPRNSVLEKRIVELKKSLAQKEYDRMTRDVNLAARYRPTESISFQCQYYILTMEIINVNEFLALFSEANEFRTNWGFSVCRHRRRCLFVWIHGNRSIYGDFP